MLLQTSELTSRAAAEAFVGGVCFKVGPPVLVGAELEWLTCLHRPGTANHGARPDLSLVRHALGPYAPKSLSPSSPALPLPAGSVITIEPGGQIELSSPPVASADELCGLLRSDEGFLRKLLDAHSIRLTGAAADAARPPQRQLQLPRYAAMEQRFASIGCFGTLMMCNTAATQVSLDAGASPAQIAQRWRALYAIGPALLAAFACSPRLFGAPDGVWASQRMRAWLQLDPARTNVPVDGPDPVAQYARWAVQAPLLCVRRPGADWTPPPGATFGDWIDGALDSQLGRRPDHDDLRYHLSTLFPPIRAAGHLEVRYIDAQRGHDWAVPIAVIDALMRAPAVVPEAHSLAAGTAGRWLDAARLGLRDGELRSAAISLLELAAAHAEPVLVTPIANAARRCRAGRTPLESQE
ncbi:ergothioneine biosynthesis glutamate--cysteine ligase EgtA [Skermania sp. ID1734]|uniref:ergothioneine biosynthesis glutamate--cysteine ligase EgtA n=1 Tax=Skermania sp. ID1734 TaxID=2597516 RepID=UPI00117F34A1|nr:ergothioneine biosynthesis glutamate--cysteine ligase EgtA [Skermania sp. ID1734]TSD99767.1 ergothioneine biosynthesis glutamate--cysteine ligase EgtA [Skermania sp. ID1734]